MIGWAGAILVYAASLWLTDADSPLACLILSVIAVGLLWRLLSSHYGFWNSGALYVAVSAMYILSPLLEVAVLGDTLGFDPAKMVLLTKAGVGFLLASVLGMELVRHFGRLATASKANEQGIGHQFELEHRRNFEIAAISQLVIATTLVYVVLILVRYGLSIGSFSRAELYANEFVALSLVRLFLVVISFYVYSLLHEDTGPQLLRRRTTGLLIPSTVLYVFMDILILGDRRFALTLLMGLATLFMPKRVKPKHLLAAISLALVLTMYGSVRNAPLSEWSSRLSDPAVLVRLSPAASEFGVWAIIGTTINDVDDMPSTFPKYWQAMPQLLPRSLLPDRPPAPSEWFARTYYPDYAATGGTFAFSVVVEAIGNFGILGIPVAGLVVGLAFGFVANLRILSAPIGLPLSLFIFAFTMRMDLPALLRNALYAFGVMAVMLCYGGLAWRLGMARTTPEQTYLKKQS